MKTLTKVQRKHKKMLKRYKALIEHAYNLRQTDSAASDISEFKAIQLLDKINRLNYLNRDNYFNISN